jgi:hypothetical protein
LYLQLSHSLCIYKTDCRKLQITKVMNVCNALRDTRTEDNDCSSLLQNVIRWRKLRNHGHYDFICQCLLIKKLLGYKQANVRIMQIEVRSCNHNCSGKSISIKDSEGVFVALGIQHATRTYQYCNLWLIWPHIIFAHYLKKVRFLRKKLLDVTGVLLWSLKALPKTCYSKN